MQLGDATARKVKVYAQSADDHVLKKKPKSRTLLVTSAGSSDFRFRFLTLQTLRGLAGAGIRGRAVVD